MSDVLSILTPSQGLEQRLDADVKEAWILLAGRHGCRGYVATVTDSRGRTGWQDEALQTEQARERGERSERERETDAGGQPAMRMLRLSAAECTCACLFVCVCEHKRNCVCVCVSEKKKKTELYSALPAFCVAILLANTPHPLSVLLSQDSDTQMLVKASSQSS